MTDQDAAAGSLLRFPGLGGVSGRRRPIAAVILLRLLPALTAVLASSTTVAWLGIVACQVGTAFAVRTDHSSLRQVGLLTNKLLLAGIAVALAFAAALIYLPALQGVFGTAALSPGQLATVAPFPFSVWGPEEVRRLLIRRYHARRLGDLQPA